MSSPDPARRSRRRLRFAGNLSPERNLELLVMGEIEIKGLISWSSNYTFLARVADPKGETLAIYKPALGERPLWDFDTGTLCKREVAAYLLATVLGWPNVPLTVLRDGPQGEGSLQLFVQSDEQQHFFTLRGKHREAMREIAVFDALINNTDRKGGHVLLGQDGRIWAIDHGVTFHEYPKLRTVIWDFVGERLSERLIADLCSLQQKALRRDPCFERLGQYLAQAEIKALMDRLQILITTQVYPDPPEDWPHIPWPPV